MSYPYTNQGIEKVNSSITPNTGRIVLLNSSNVTELTPREYYKYVDEGFVPVVVTEEIEGGSGPVMSFHFASLQYTPNGGDSTYMLDNSYISPDLDTPFVLD